MRQNSDTIDFFEGNSNFNPNKKIDKGQLSVWSNCPVCYKNSGTKEVKKLKYPYL